MWLGWGAVLTTTRILAFLRVSLHVLLALLLLVGVATAGWSWQAMCLAVPFALLYLAGTLAYNKGARFAPAITYSWLAAVLGLWVILTLHEAAFVWLEFPLVILACFVLPTIPGLLAAAAVWALTLSVTAAAGLSAIVGPTIGTIVAVGIYHFYQALRAEADHYKQLLETSGVLQERARLAREVHDTMAQGLSSIFLLGRTLEKQLESPAAKNIAATIVATAQENLREARRFVAINSGPTEALSTRLRRLAENAESRQRALGGTLDVTVTAVDIPEPVAGVIERVAREGLSNIVRHAGASKAVVTVDTVGDVAVIDVYDNGRGITGPEGYGLKGLRARVEEAGGTLNIEGNVLAAEVPLR